MMKKVLIVSFVFLGLSLHCNGQFNKGYLPLELNEPDHNVWLAWSDNFMDSSRIGDIGLKGNPFQNLQNLYPSDSISLSKVMLEGYEHSMYIFTFGDSLNIQTYDGEKKEIIKTENYSYKKLPFKERTYLIYFDGYPVQIVLETMYGFFYGLNVSFQGLPDLNSHSEENVWIAKVKTNIIKCENAIEYYSISPYSDKKMRDYIARKWPDNTTKSANRMIKLFTFGDSLRIQTYDVFKSEIVQTECYKYEPIENTIYCYWVYIASDKIKLTASPIYESHYNLSISCE